MTSTLANLKRKATRQGWGKWIRNQNDEQAVLDGCYFDPAAADHVCQFFARFLKHSKGRWAGQSFELADFQVDLLSRLFGWKRADGSRRFRQAGIWLPKKNTKSTLASGLTLYMLTADGEAVISPSAQAGFLRYRLNCWTQASTTWVADDRFMSCAGSTELTDDELRQVEWHGGLDLASVTDVAALVLIGQHNDRWVVRPTFWINEEQAALRQQRDSVNYQRWADQGYMRVPAEAEA